MPNSLQSLWLIPALRGLLALILGILLLAYPGVSLLFMIGVIGAFVFISGLFAVIVAFMNRHIELLWRNNLADGVISMLIGLLVWIWPGVTSVILVYLIAAWAVLSGVLQLTGAIRMRVFFQNSWLGVIIGALLIIIGIGLFVHPGAGAVAISVMIGIAAIVYGAAALTIGWQIRRLQR